MTQPLRITAIEIDGNVTRPIQFGGPPGDALHDALREAMLKRGCLRDRAHKGQCMNCALLPQCAVWPVVAPADPTQRQRGPFLRPVVLRLPTIPAQSLPVGTPVTYGATIVQDATFPTLWGALAAAFVHSARQIAEWGVGLQVREGEQAARRGAISVGRVRWVDPVTGESAPFFFPTEGSLEPPLAAHYDAAEIAAIDRHTLHVTFLTPTRLVAAGTTLRAPDLTILVRRIAERLDAVAERVGAATPDILMNETIIEAAGRVRVRDAGVRWLGDPAKGGFVGPVTLVGESADLAMLAPVLRWGAALGVGKGTLTGNGRFVVGPVPPSAVVTLPSNEAEDALFAADDQQRPEARSRSPRPQSNRSLKRNRNR